MLSIFGSLIRQYFLNNPQVVERLTNAVLHALIEHVAPTTAAELGGLTGEASASPSGGSAGVGSAGGQVISR
jgi:hypothetical protein